MVFSVHHHGNSFCASDGWNQYSFCLGVCGSGLCRRTAWKGSLHLHLLLAFLGLLDRRKVEFIKKKKKRAISLNHLLSLNSNRILSVRDCVSLIHIPLGNRDILLALDWWYITASVKVWGLQRRWCMECQSWHTLFFPLSRQESASKSHMHTWLVTPRSFWVLHKPCHLCCDWSFHIPVLSGSWKTERLDSLSVCNETKHYVAGGGTNASLFIRTLDLDYIDIATCRHLEFWFRGSISLDIVSFGEQDIIQSLTAEHWTSILNNS